jgi:hypothetical protein
MYLFHLGVIASANSACFSGLRECTHGAENAEYLGEVCEIGAALGLSDTVWLLLLNHYVVRRLSVEEHLEVADSIKPDAFSVAGCRQLREPVEIGEWAPVALVEPLSEAWYEFRLSRVAEESAELRGHHAGGERFTFHVVLAASHSVPEHFAH